MIKDEYVILVDENDSQIGKEEKLKAHEKGLLHRAFSVFLFREKGDDIQLLLQQRAKRKYHCGGLWANTCCSHPREGEDLVGAGKRRLKQEIGIKVDELQNIGKFTYKAEFENGLIEHEVDNVLIGKYDADAKDITFNPDEVEAVRWVSLQELEKEFEQELDIFCPWFPLALSMISPEEIVGLFEEE